MNVTAKTKKLGVIGDPIDHSFSPKLHNYISQKTGNDYIYSAYHVTPENLRDAINGMRALDIRGINVTAPHKSEVIKYLDYVSSDAEQAGSVNTIVNDNGTLKGYSTDGEGLYLSMIKAGISVKDANIIIIGCGGVVKPITLRLIKENPKSITLVNRTREKAVVVADEISCITGFKIETSVNLKEYDIVINTTTAGMGKLKDIYPWDSIDEIKDKDIISSKTSAIDLIYNPPCTKFLQFAKEKGAKTLNGLDMLIYQGVVAYELFTGTKVTDDLIEEIRKEVFKV